jgi:hypothetical protein
MQNPQKGVAGWEAHHKVAEAASQPAAAGRIEAVRPLLAGWPANWNFQAGCRFVEQNQVA